MAGVIPGLMIGVMMMIATYFLAKRSGFKSTKPATFKERYTAFKDSFWALLIIVVVIGGIYGGIFTPTEAGAFSVMYAFFVSFFIYKDTKYKDLYRIILDSAQTSSMIFFIIANAMLFAHFLTDEQIPQHITQMILEANVGPLMFLLIVNILLLLMGQFMEPSSVVMITVPLLLPIGVALGIDPIHLGVIMVVNMEIGMITPPVGTQPICGQWNYRPQFKTSYCSVFTNDRNFTFWIDANNIYSRNFSMVTTINVWIKKLSKRFSLTFFYNLDRLSKKATYDYFRI
jgi:C4-dicarboxylate transporter DctM subunit